MMRKPSSIFRSILSTAALLICALSGCGESYQVAQVRGKVVFKNGPMPAAGVRMIRLEPTRDSTAEIRKGASGSINDDGTFEIYTRRPGDGVHVGKYAVTFTFLKSPTDQNQLLAAKYTVATTTPYQLTVDRDLSDLEYVIEPRSPAAR
jgi:hypothetical protein